MRVPLPSRRVRRTIDGLLVTYYRTSHPAAFTAALRALAQFYRVPVPPIRWRRAINRGRWLGQTDETGQIDLIRPAYWTESERTWVRTVYHEWAHCLLWAEAEEKAERYERRFCAGIGG